ncbi:ParA family protein [SAR86 cluster bacterium]|nr:ParA family protein [SAR86 cluster bacterium]
MLITLVVANQKGGVGKTTTALNLAASLSAASRKVLLIDLDSQGNSTSGAGEEKNEDLHSLLDVMVNESDSLEKVIEETKYKFDLIPANPDLISAEIELSSLPSPTSILKKKLTDMQASYDYVVIDCPPSLGMMSVSALRAASKVLIPLQCEYYSLEGLASMNKTIKEINEATGENIEINGILRTMYDSRIRLSREVSKELEEHFSEQLCDTVIPRNVKLAEAPSFGMPALYYEPEAKGTLAYLALAGEIINKFESNINVS